MKFTQKWAWQNQDEVSTNTDTGTHADGYCHRITTPIPSRHHTNWLSDYRNQIRAIDTQEKAAKAIQDYWTEVAKEWDNGTGIIKLNF